LAGLFRHAAFEAIRRTAPGLDSPARGADQAQQPEAAIAELQAAEDQFEDFHGSLNADCLRSRASSYRFARLMK
jgi:hypothetical protein